MIGHNFWTCPVRKHVGLFSLAAGRDGNARDRRSGASRQVMCVFQDEATEYKREWKRMWWILRTVCMTVSWLQSNRVVHQGSKATIESSVAAFQAAGLRQLRALAKRERQNPRTTRVLFCLELTLFQQDPKEAPRHEASHVQPPGPPSAPALLSEVSSAHLA